MPQKHQFLFSLFGLLLSLNVLANDKEADDRSQINPILQQIESLPPEQRNKLMRILTRRYPPPAPFAGTNLAPEQRRALHEALREGKLSPEQKELLNKLRQERLQQFENMPPEQRRLLRELPPPID